MKVSELIGAELDCWVARAEGWVFFWSKHNYWSVTKPNGASYSACNDWVPYDPDTGAKNEKPHPSEAMQDFYPSSDWEQGGPIIERERIWLDPVEAGGTFRGERQTEAGWLARAWGHVYNERGPTPLIAAMRAYVASKFGDEVTG